MHVQCMVLYASQFTILCRLLQFGREVSLAASPKDPGNAWFPFAEL